MAVTRDDLIELVIRLENRVKILHLIADGECAGGARERGQALLVLSHDMEGDLAVLSDGIGTFEDVA